MTTPEDDSAMRSSMISLHVDPSDAATILEILDGFSGRGRGPVERLAHLTEHPDPEVRAALVWTVAGWSTPGVIALVERLANAARTSRPGPGRRRS